MPRTFTLVSVCVHAAVLGCIYVAQAIDIGPLPIPREALAFTGRLVKIADIALPAAPKRLTTSSSPVSPQAAPIDAPPVVMLETGREMDSSTASTSSLHPQGGDPTDGGGGTRDVQARTRFPVMRCLRSHHRRRNSRSTCTRGFSRRERSRTSAPPIRRWRELHIRKAS